MVFLNRAFYENIGIPKSKISGSFNTFLKEYVKNMIEYYVQMEYEALLGIDIPDVPIKEDTNIIQYILLITENPETSRLIHDKIYRIIHHFAKFVTERCEKCSFESVMKLFNSDDIPGNVMYFFMPMEVYYAQKVETELIVSVESIYIHRETFYLFEEICCSNLWIDGNLSSAFKDLVYTYFFGFLQHFQNWIRKKRDTENKLEIFLEYIAETYSNDLGNHMRNEILRYEESQRNWENSNIYRIYEIPEKFIGYCKVIIQYLLIEFIYCAKRVAQSNEKRKIYPVDLFLGMESAELLSLPVFFKRGGEPRFPPSPLL
jgi:hypothetical protein